MNLFLEGSRDYSVKHLDLSFNFLNAKSAVILEAAMYHNKKISFLRLNDNPIGRTGARALLRLLARLPTLHDVEFFGIREPQKQRVSNFQSGDAVKATYVPKLSDKAAVPGESALAMMQCQKDLELKLGFQVGPYELLLCAPQRYYELNLTDAGGRAVLKLLLMLKDDFEDKNKKSELPLGTMKFDGLVMGRELWVCC